MTTKTYNELLDELDSYNVRTLAATEQYESNLTDIQAAVDESEANAEAAQVAAELPSATVPIYVLGVLTQLTEVLTAGNRVTTYTYIDGNLTQAVVTYLGDTITATYTYDIDGNWTGVTRV